VGKSFLFLPKPRSYNHSPFTARTNQHHDAGKIRGIAKILQVL